MAKVIKPSVSPEQIGQRPKKKSPVDDFAGALAVQAGKTLGTTPARTAPAEGQINNKTANLAAVSGHGRRTPSSSSHAVPSPGPVATETAVRIAPARGEVVSTPQKPRISGFEPRPQLSPAVEKDLLAAISREPHSRLHRSPDGLTRETQLRAEPQSRAEVPRGNRASGSIPLPQFGPNTLVPQMAAPSVPGPQLVRAQPSTPLSQIAQLVVARAPEAGSVKAELTLYPEHLGSVQVQLSVDPSGSLSAVVSASQAAIMQLGGSIADLQAALEASGLDISSLDLKSHPEGSTQQDSREFAEGADRTTVQLADVAAEPVQTAALIDGGAYLDMAL